MNPLSTFQPDKSLSLNAESIDSNINSGIDGSSRILPSAGGISSSFSSPTNRSNQPAQGTTGMMSSEFRPESVILQSPSTRKNRFKAIRENKEMVIQFLMSMPNVTSKPPTTVRMPSLDRTGQIKLGGCLPLIHPAWHHIVVVDPDYNSLTNVSQAIARLGYTVTSISTAEEAADVIVENLVDLVLCTDRTPTSGCSILRNLIEKKMYLQETKR